MNERKVLDCRDAGKGCSVRIEGSEEEVLPLAHYHVVNAHGYPDTPDVHEGLKKNLKTE